MKLLRVVGHVESRFDPFGDDVSVGARQVHGLCQAYHGSEIVLDEPDGTPRRRGSSGSSFWSVWR